MKTKKCECCQKRFKDHDWLNKWERKICFTCRVAYGVIDATAKVVNMNNPKTNISYILHLVAERFNEDT
jgi:hypothetical protein